MMDWIETTLGDGDSDGFYVATADSQQTRLDSKSCIPCKIKLKGSVKKREHRIYVWVLPGSNRRYM